jgi:molecular chaperone GrpE
MAEQRSDHGGPTEELERRLAESDAGERAAGALRAAVESLADDEAQAGQQTAAPLAVAEEDERMPAALDELRRRAAERDEFHGRMLRAMADLDNLQKRTRREVDDALRRGKHTLLTTLLPVFDNLELSLGVSGAASDPAALLTGIRMILDQFSAALADRGIQRRGEIGEPFDPRVHEAIGTLPTNELEPNTVANVLRPGYTDGDMVVRPAQVQVAAAPAAEDGGADEAA